MRETGEFVISNALIQGRIPQSQTEHSRPNREEVLPSEHQRCKQAIQQNRPYPIITQQHHTATDKVALVAKHQY